MSLPQYKAYGRVPVCNLNVFLNVVLPSVQTVWWWCVCDVSLPQIHCMVVCQSVTVQTVWWCVGLSQCILHLGLSQYIINRGKHQVVLRMD
jgi:hypothetical protein